MFKHNKPKTISIVNTFTLEKANAILQNTRLLEMQILNFAGSRWDATYISIHRKLLANLNGLKNISGDFTSKVESDLILSIEETIRVCLRKLEETAMGNDRNQLKATRNTAEDLYKAEMFLNHLQEEIEVLDINLEELKVYDDSGSDLENHIKNLSEALEDVDTQGDEHLTKDKEQLYKHLIKCSGKLKRLEKVKKSSVQTTSTEDVTNEPKPTEEANIFADLQQLKLHWMNLKQKLLYERFDSEETHQIARELKSLEEDVKLVSDSLTRVCKRQNSVEDDLKKIVEQLQRIKKTINSYSGLHGDESYLLLKEELNGCMEALDETPRYDNMKCVIAKKKLREKILGYISLLEEKAIKI